MIRKLRRKFVLTNMLFVSLVLLIVFAALMLSSYRELEQASRDQLFRALSGKPANGPFEIGKHLNRKNQLDAYVLVELDESGAILRTESANLSASDDVIASAVTAANASEKTEGFLAEYRLRYGSLALDGITRFAFVDVSREYASMQNLLVSSLVVGAAGLLSFYFISLLLANLAVRPVEKAWNQQRQFVADASHELKTPLTVILANNNILLSHPDSTIGQEQKWIENTQAEGLRMKGLIDDLLFLAKSDAGAPLVLSDVSLSDVVWKALLPFEPAAFEKGVTLESEIAPELSVRGSEAQLTQLVAILTDNAIKYAGTGGTVRVTLSAKGDAVRIRVHNTGEPIPPKDLPHVFERFYRADRSRPEGGSGLGLAIADSIVTRLGGKLSAASEPGEGTTFTAEFRRTAS